MKNNKWLIISLFIFSLSIILSSIWLGYSIQKLENIQVLNSADNSNVITISEVSSYLGMNEDDVLGIINTEKKILESTGSYTGAMFPYFIVNEKMYFYKQQIDEWLKDVSTNRKNYDTKKGYIL